MAETAELQLLDAIQEYVERAVAPLHAELADLRARLAAVPAGAKGEPGPMGQVDYDRVGEILALAADKAAANAMAAAPKAKDGAPGKDAVVDYALIREFTAAAAITALAAQPKAKDGEPGRDGKDADQDAIVDRVLALMPTPKDGPQGLRGADGKDGAAGDRGADGKDGKDGAPGERGADGNHGRDGAAGEPGRDADPAMIDAAVARALAALPQPPEVDRAALVREVIAAVPAPVEQATIVRAVLEQIPAAPVIEPGLQVSDVEAIVARALAAMPVPVPPVFDVAAVAPLIEDRIAAAIKTVEIPPAVIDEPALVQRVLALVPKPKDGAPGQGVHPDTVALMVREAVEEFAKSVKLPADGKPGRDVLDLDIVESLDQGQSYPAGTFARHDGGTVLAVRDTDPLGDDLEAAGWKVTQDGIKDVVREDCDDERVTRVVVRTTSGRRFAVDCVTASGVKDQGPHRPGMKYRAGDAVTHDESYWIARRDTAKSPPGEDWRLILKGKRRA